VGLIILAAPGREPEQLPVGRPVTGSAETSGIKEGFRKVNRVAVHPPPIIGKHRGHTTGDVRRQMRDAHPGQNQKPRVRGDEADVAPPRFRVPAAIAVSAAEMARR
jgi:hypothetical protein